MCPNLTQLRYAAIPIACLDRHFSYKVRMSRKSLLRRRGPVVRRNLLTLIKPPNELRRYVLYLPVCSVAFTRYFFC